MPLSGEAIRLMNYIDDVAVTLRRVLATVPTLSAEERARVAQHLLQARPSADEVAQALAASKLPVRLSPSSERGRWGAGWRWARRAPAFAYCLKT